MFTFHISHHCEDVYSAESKTQPNTAHKNTPITNLATCQRWSNFEVSQCLFHTQTWSADIISSYWRRHCHHRDKHTHTTPKHTQPESPRRPLVDISFSKDDPLNKSWQLCHLSTKERLTSLTSAFSSWSDVRIWAVKKSEAALGSEILLNTSDSSFPKDLFPIKKSPHPKLK